MSYRLTEDAGRHTLSRWTTALLLVLVMGFSCEPATAHVVKKVKSSTCQRNWKTPEGARSQALCFAGHFDVSQSTTDQVGECESGWYWHAENGDHKGIFQHDEDLWPGRVSHYMPKGSTWIFSARTQSIVTTRMVLHEGWSPWSQCL